MREIKFRVWLTQISKMIYKEDVNTDKFKELQKLSNYKYPFEEDELYPWNSVCGWLDLYIDSEYMIPLQYTGVKDKNGTEIYEGDIVNYFADGLGTVKFEHGCFVIEGELHKDFFNEICGEIEVVGNIYENLELLA